MNEASDSSSWGPDQRARERQLFERFALLDESDPERDDIRDELVTMHLPLVRHMARRYRDRGEQFDDLTQVGTVGLIQAVDRFDADRGLEFSTYATPLILGEIKRHFRDRASVIRMPRRLQELSSAVALATETLTNRLNRSPTVAEIAEAVDCSIDDVLETLEARQSRMPDSLDSALDDDDFTSTIGLDDPSMQAVVDRESLRTLLEQLPDREREIVMLRFFKDMTQTQIADEMGISQMHVSRLLASSLGHLREGFAA